MLSSEKILQAAFCILLIQQLLAFLISCPQIHLVLSLPISESQYQSFLQELPVW